MKNFAAARRFGHGTNANSFINPNAVEQIVGRERRERLSQDNRAGTQGVLWRSLFLKLFGAATGCC